MHALFTSFLIMVPAPTGEGEPTGPAPALQYAKWVNGSFESNVTVYEVVPVQKAVVVNINGKMETRTIVSYERAIKIVRQQVDFRGADFYTVDGKKLEDTAWQKAIGNGAMIAIAGDGQLPHAAYRKVLREGMIIMVAPKK